MGGRGRLRHVGTPGLRQTQHTLGLLSLAAMQVFDDKATFAEWFGDALGKAAGGGAADEWLATEKRVVVIHRLHQILEPFMLRRQVQDVEGKLPPKVRAPSLARKTWLPSLKAVRQKVFLEFDSSLLPQRHDFPLEVMRRMLSLGCCVLAGAGCRGEGCWSRSLLPAREIK